MAKGPFKITLNWEGRKQFFLVITSSMSCCPFGSLLIRVWMTWNTGLGSPVSGATLQNKPRRHGWRGGNKHTPKPCWASSPRLRLRIAAQTVHDQRAKDHGQVGATHPHLAAEEKSRQLSGLPAVTQKQAGALLEGGAEEREGGADWCVNCSLFMSFSPPARQRSAIYSAAVETSSTSVWLKHLKILHQLWL